MINDMALWRGKRIDTGDWVQGYLLQNEISCIIVASYADLGVNGIKITEAYDVIPDTLGRHTGLKDKHGNLIFEGDIVSVYDIKAEIKWNNSTASFHASRKYPDISTEHLGYFEGKCEITGNIHDGEFAKGAGAE